MKYCHHHSSETDGKKKKNEPKPKSTHVFNKFTTMAFIKVGGLRGTWSFSPAQTLHLELNLSQSQPGESRETWMNEGEGHKDEEKNGFEHTWQLWEKVLREHDEEMGTVRRSLLRSLLWR